MTLYTTQNTTQNDKLHYGRTHRLSRRQAARSERRLGRAFQRAGCASCIGVPDPSASLPRARALLARAGPTPEALAVLLDASKSAHGMDLPGARNGSGESN